ncbi:zinc finger, CCHC-type containing protein [Tanacetum coccineum]
MEAQAKAELNKKAHSAVILYLGNKVMREVTEEMTATGVWSKLETLYMRKSLANKLYLKKKLYTFYMSAGRKISEHIDDVIPWSMDGKLDFGGRDGHTKFKGNQERSKAKGDDDTRRDNCVYSLDGRAVAGELNASVEEKDSLAQLSERHTTQGVIDYVHSDLWGPSQVESLGAIKRRKPNLENLRVFGCIAYAKVPSQHLTKLDDRSTRMVYLGNEQGSKAYRLFDPTTQKICVSRDVKFKENETWDWKEYMSEHINNEPEWTDFKIENFKVTSEHHNQGTQPSEEDNEFPNNDNDGYASPMIVSEYVYVIYSIRIR